MNEEQLVYVCWILVSGVIGLLFVYFIYACFTSLPFAKVFSIGVCVLVLLFVICSHLFAFNEFFRGGSEEEEFLGVNVE